MLALIEPNQRVFSCQHERTLFTEAFFFLFCLGVDGNESKEGNGVKNEPFITFVRIRLFRERFSEGKFAFLSDFFFNFSCLRSTKKDTCQDFALNF